MENTHLEVNISLHMKNIHLEQTISYDCEWFVSYITLAVTNQKKKKTLALLLLAINHQIENLALLSQA